MYIAICDDDAARRKHMERLLSREASLRLQANIVLYIDAYGYDISSIRTLLKYNVFLIDHQQHIENAATTVMGIRATGCMAPIYFYNCGPMVGTDTVTCTNDVIYLPDYPTEADLTAIVDLIHVALMSQKPTLEVRTEESAHYILPSDIVYVERDNYYIQIMLADHRLLRVKEQFSYFVEVLSTYPSFFVLKKEYICNHDYVTDISFKKVVLLTKYTAPLTFKEYLHMRKSYSH